MIATTYSNTDADRNRDRIVNLSDGVFAIAITLLVLDIRVPDISENLLASELPGALLSLWPSDVLKYVPQHLIPGTRQALNQTQREIAHLGDAPSRP